jgi:hypothetical protein
MERRPKTNGKSGHLNLAPISVLRSLSRYGACCARGLWKFSGLLRIVSQHFVRFFSEQLLRWRDGSICCAVSRRYRNAYRLSRQTLSALCCVRGPGKECLTPPGRRGASQGRAGRTALERAPSRRDVHPSPPPVGLPPRATRRSQART